MRGVALVGVLLTLAGCGGDGGSTVPRMDAGPCVADPAPPGAAACPAVCSSCLPGNVCRIDCASGACSDRTIVCPAEYACDVACTGLDACDTARVECPDAYACTVSCSSLDACGDLSLRCAGASCTLTCSGSGASDSCVGASVTCGSGPCTTVCEGDGDVPGMDCTASCGCASC